MPGTDIVVTIDAKDLASAVIKKLQRNMTDLKSVSQLDLFSQIQKSVKIDEFSNKLKKLHLQIEDLGKGRLMFRDTKTGQFKNTVKSVKEVNNQVGKMSNAFKTLSITLPLMFAFQNIGKAMKSVIDPALELMGVNDVYQQMLAMKYLPTAEAQLDNVLALGDAWDKIPEPERKAEGDAIVLANALAELVSYTAQVTQTMAAFGDMLGTIDLTPFGVGVEYSGKNLGSLIGAAIGVSSGLAALRGDANLTVTTMGGLGQAISIQGTDNLVSFLYQIGILKDTGLPSLDSKLSDSGNKFDNLGSTVSTTSSTMTSKISGFVTDSIINMGNFANTIKDKVNNFTTDVKSGVTKFTTDVQTGTQKFVDDVKTKVTDFGDKLKTGATTAFTNFQTGMENIIPNIKNAWIEFLNWLGSKWNAFKSMLGPIGKLLPSYSSLPLVALRGLQAGGVVTRPTTALLGERGPEAVIPLDRIGSIGGINVTINTSTIGGNTDQLAREIAEKFSFELARVRY